MKIQPIRKRINPPSPPLLSPPTPLHRHGRPYILRPSDSLNQTPQVKDPKPSNLAIVAASGTNGVDYSSDEMNNSTTNQGSPVGDGEQVEAGANSTIATNRRLGHCSYGTETSAGGSSIFLSPSSHQDFTPQSISKSYLISGGRGKTQGDEDARTTTTTNGQRTKDDEGDEEREGTRRRGRTKGQDLNDGRRGKERETRVQRRRNEGRRTRPYLSEEEEGNWYKLLEREGDEALSKFGFRQRVTGTTLNELGFSFYGRPYSLVRT